MRIVSQRGLPSSGVAHPLLHPGRRLAPATPRSKVGARRSKAVKRGPRICAEHQRSSAPSRAQCSTPPSPSCCRRLPLEDKEGRGATVELRRRSTTTAA
jgi:hypothetical protein